MVLAQNAVAETGRGGCWLLTSTDDKTTLEDAIYILPGMPLEAFMLQHQTHTSWMGKADALGGAQHMTCPLGCQRQRPSPPPYQAGTAGMAY